MSSLGYIAGGAAQGFGQGQQYAANYQDSKATATLGAAARVLAGGQPASQGQGGQQSSTPQLDTQTQQAPIPQQQTPVQQQAPQQNTGVVRSPTAQPPQQIPLMQTPQQSSPPIANAATPLPGTQQPAQAAPAPSPPPSGQTTAQLSQQSQQPPQQSQQPMLAHPSAQGQGPWTMQGLAQAILKSNPNISDRALGMALFKASPLLNAQGLAQYRNLGLILRQEDMQDRSARGWEDLGLKKEREGRIAKNNAAKEQQTRAIEEQKIAVLAAGRQLTADIQAAGFPPDEKKVAAAQEKYQKAVDEAKGKFESSIKPEDEGSDNEQPIVYDDKGRAMRYKGSGDPKDPKNYAPVE